MTGSNEPTPELLAKWWLEAKQREELAKADRLRIEAMLAEHVEVKPEGSKTNKLSDGHKVKTQGRLNRRFDFKAFAEKSAQPLAQAFPDIPPPIKHKPELDLKGVEWWKKHHPDAYAEHIAPYLTVTPGKTGFEIEPPKAEEE